MESKVFRAFYSCKAAWTNAFSKVLKPTDVGLHWWRLFSLFFEGIKREALQKLLGGYRVNEEVRTHCSQLAQYLSEATGVWEGVEHHGDYRRGKVKLAHLELLIYKGLYGLHKRLTRSKVPDISTWSASATLFWFRFFGLNTNPIPSSSFGAALRIHTLLEHSDTTPVVACPPVFRAIVTNVLEWGSDKMVSATVWTKMIQRYGPFDCLYQKMSSVCTARGDLAAWFMKDGGRVEAGQKIRQGALPWVIRLGRLGSGMAFVLTYESADKQFVHTPIENDLKEGGEYFIKGEPERKFPTLLKLVANVCQRMGWYQGGYALKEEGDRWLAAHAREEKKTDLSESGRFDMLNNHFGAMVDPTCALSSSATTQNGRRAKREEREGGGGLPASVLRWLDDSKTAPDIVKTILHSTKPEDEATASKHLKTIFSQIDGHLRKQAGEIQSLTKMVADLTNKVALYEGDPLATHKCTTQQLIQLESNLTQVSQRLKVRISESVERSLQIPNEFLCPLTREVFKDPVITKDGHTYERKAIAMWFANHDTSPMTNMRLNDKSLTPNISLRNSIFAFKVNHRRFNSKDGTEEL